ncbi:hypothetical protein ACJX0J_012654, partial [Zea mays]
RESGPTLTSEEEDGDDNDDAAQHADLDCALGRSGPRQIKQDGGMIIILYKVVCHAFTINRDIQYLDAKEEQ